MEKIQNISDRIDLIAKREDLSIRKFEEKINVSQGVINKIIKSNGDVKASILIRILEEFPHYNPDWLLTGNGEMLLNIKNDIIYESYQNYPFLLKRTEELSIENAFLRREIDDIKRQKKYRDIATTDIAADPELNYSGGKKNKK